MKLRTYSKSVWQYSSDGVFDLDFGGLPLPEATSGTVDGGGCLT